MGRLPRLFGVVGAGQMGAGIAQVAATSGLSVCLVDSSQQSIDRALQAIRSSLSRLVGKGKLTGEAGEAALERLTTSASLEVRLGGRRYYSVLVPRVMPPLPPRDAAGLLPAHQHPLQALVGADFVVEAVAEDEAIKKSLFLKLDRVTPEHAVLASNTSSISITRLAAATSRPASVVGMHFMNPVPIIGLVELVRGLQTSDETYEATQRLAAALGKTTCASADRPGFIVNRILMPMINEAFYAVSEVKGGRRGRAPMGGREGVKSSHSFCLPLTALSALARGFIDRESLRSERLHPAPQGVGTPEDVDLGMRLGTNQPMGPLALADFIGLDTCLAIMRVLRDQLGDDKYRPCPLLVQYVDAGWLGKKAGRGVYRYEQ